MDFIDWNILTKDFGIFLRMLIAAVLTGILGWERETTGKEAGLRTHILVGVGATLFVVIGQVFVENFRHFDKSMQFDPIRIVEAIVTGVSFIGAGIIFVAKDKGSVKNLTTAASIWATSAIGMIVGLERYFLAFGSTVIIFVILRVLAYWEFRDITETQKEK